MRHFLCIFSSSLCAQSHPIQVRLFHVSDLTVCVCIWWRCKASPRIILPWKKMMIMRLFFDMMAHCVQSASNASSRVCFLNFGVILHQQYWMARINKSRKSCWRNIKMALKYSGNTNHLELFSCAAEDIITMIWLNSLQPGGSKLIWYQGH